MRAFNCINIFSNMKWLLIFNAIIALLEKLNLSFC
jgi:hypothetical protein